MAPRSLLLPALVTLGFAAACGASSYFFRSLDVPPKSAAADREFEFLGCYDHRKSIFVASPPLPLHFFVLRPVSPASCFVWCWNYPLYSLHNETCTCGWQMYNASATACDAPMAACDGPGCELRLRFRVYANRRRAKWQAALPAAQPPFRTPMKCLPPDDWDPNRLFVFTYITKFMALTPFVLASALFNGLALHVYGLYAEKSPEALPGFLRKVYCARDVVNALPASTLMLFVDGADVVFNASPDQIVSTYNSIGAKVLFGAEMNCYLVKCTRMSKLNITSPYRFLNSGVYIGRARDVRFLLSDFHRVRQQFAKTHRIHGKNTKELHKYDKLAMHDQYWFGLLYDRLRSGPREIVLDSQVDLVLTTSFFNTSDLCQPRPQMRICHCGMESCPLIYHIPGRTRTHVMAQLYPLLWWYQQYLAPTRPVWIGGHTVPFGELDLSLGHLFTDQDALAYLRGNTVHSGLR